MTSLPVAAIVWRRIDVPGHDVMRLRRSDDGWLLSGVAVWSESGHAHRLDYVISLDGDWHTRSCSVDGFVGARSVGIAIVREETGTWTSGGVPVPEIEGCVDIDLSFSPATNLLPIRRLALGEGERRTVRAAWLRVPNCTLEPLEQVYARTGPNTYAYESGEFSRTLIVDRSGLVVEYPGLWTAEAVESTLVEVTG